jgi:hypothetical protein
VPTPPKIASPVNMFTIGTAPPAGVKASRPPFTDPLEVSVVTVAHSAVLALPKRTSLSAMLPPLWVELAARFTPDCRSTGEPCCSAVTEIATPMASIANMAV